MFAFFAGYPTFLVFLAIVISASLTMLFTPALIHFLKMRHIGQQVREDGPQTHLVKQGTPTMGGIIMMLASFAAILLLSAPDLQIYFLLGAALLTAILGAVDDSSKIAHERSLGLTPKAKLIFQFLIAAVFILGAVNVLNIPPTVDIPFICNVNLGVLTTTIPLQNGYIFQIPWLYLIFCMILLVGLCNAVNLTDGLDGLAAGTVMMVMFVMAAIAYREGLLNGAIFSAALAGSCIGFLWFNSHPADIFMGDTGSLMLGMSLGCVAIITKTEFIVIIIGLLFVFEALSVIIQVAYFRRTRKRIFRMAPLHHHYEKLGWSETKVVVRFWIASGVLAACGFVTWFASYTVAMG